MTPPNAPVDRPVTEPARDLFDRAGIARAFAQQIMQVPPNESSVFGVAGAWGSGKSSFVNFVLKGLPDSVSVFHFNPWFFSTTDGLVNSFLAEFASFLELTGRGKAKEVGEHLQRYAKLLRPVKFIPIVGTAADAVLDSVETVGGFMGERFSSLSLTEQRKKIDSALEGKDQRIIVVVDDVDRLTDEEIRAVMRLVRLVADFPNTSYLLAFDRARVEDALALGHGDGRAYLEKIFQFLFDLPPPRRSALRGFLVEGVNAAINAASKTGPLHEDFAVIFEDLVFPLIRTPRDVRRFCSGLPLLLETLGEDVAFGDAIAIEAIRIFEPDLFQYIEAHRELLTVAPRESAAKPKGNGIPNPPTTNLVSIQDVVRRLFPMARRFFENQHYGSEWLAEWRRERRVAHPEVLSFVLERTWPSNIVPVSEAAEIFSLLGQPVPLAAALKELSDEKLEHCLESLLDYRSEFSEDHLEGVPTLIDLRTRLRERPTSLFDLGAEMKLRRVLYRMLRVLQGKQDARVRFEKIYAAVQGGVLARQLLINVLDFEHADDRILDAADVDGVSAQFLTDVLGASDPELADPRMTQTFFWAWRYAHGHNDATSLARVLESFAKKERLRALIVGATSRQRTVGVESGIQTTSWHIHWDSFVEVFGADRLKAGLSEVLTMAPPDVSDERATAALASAREWLDQQP